MYEIGMQVTGIVCGAILLIFFSVNAIYLSLQSINDEKLSLFIPNFIRKLDFIGDLGGAELILYPVLFAFIVLISMLIWPLVIVASIWLCVVLILRKAVRFKKKVKKALEGKDKPNHTHEWERE